MAEAIAILSTGIGLHAVLLEPKVFEPKGRTIQKASSKVFQMSQSADNQPVVRDGQLVGAVGLRHNAARIDKKTKRDR